MPPSRRRLSGPLVAISLVSVIAVTVAWAVYRWYATLWPTGAIMAMAAVDDDRVLVIREGEGGQFPVYLTLVDREAGVKWATGLYGVQRQSGSGIGISARDGHTLVSVKATDAKGTPETHTFHLSTGKFASRLSPAEAALAGGVAPVDEGDVVASAFGERLRLRQPMRAARVDGSVLLIGAGGELARVSNDLSEIYGARLPPEHLAVQAWHAAPRTLWVSDGLSVRPLVLATLRPAIGLSDRPPVEVANPRAWVEVVASR